MATSVDGAGFQAQVRAPVPALRACGRSVGEVALYSSEVSPCTCCIARRMYGLPTASSDNAEASRRHRHLEGSGGICLQRLRAITEASSVRELTPAFG